MASFPQASPPTPFTHLYPPIRATFPAHLIRLDFTTRTILGKEYRSFSSSLYTENILRVNGGNGISEDSRVITQVVRQGCPLSPVLFDLYLDEVIRIWVQKLKLSKYYKELIFNTLLFADDHLITGDTEDNLQRAVYLLYSISKEYNLEIATGKTKVLGFVGTDRLRAKILINDETLDQVSQFTYLCCSISYQFFQ